MHPNPNEPLSYATPPDPTPRRRRLALAVLTLAGPVSFISFWLLAMIVTAAAGSRAFVGLCILGAVLSPIVGLSSACRGFNLHRESTAFLLGAFVNGVLLMLVVLIVIYILFNI